MRGSNSSVCVMVLLVSLVLAACGDEPRGTGGENQPPASPPAASAAKPAPGAPIAFRDIRAQSGIAWKHTFLDSESGTSYKLNPYDHGSGVLIADANGDGHDDLLFLNFVGTNGLYLGQGNGTFKDQTEKSGLAMPRSISVGGCFGDYDNDGDQDLYVTTYKSGNHLFRNRGDATFEDVTKQANVSHVGHSNSATFFDYDLDGNLDLYLTNIGSFTTDTINEQVGNYVGVALDFQKVADDTNRLTPGENNVLWRNKGDGTFEDVTAKAGVGSPSWNGDCAVADYDGDGDLDLYVANMFGPNSLYQNNGDGTFHDVTEELLGKTTWGAIGCRFFDADNDGRPDLYVVDMHSDMWVKKRDEKTRSEINPRAKYRTPYGPSLEGELGYPVTGQLEKLTGKVLFGNSFFHNLGGKFEEMSDRAGLETYWPWAITVADFDRDGWKDVFVTAGMSYPYFYWPNSLLRNDGNLHFTDLTRDAGLEPRPGGNELDLTIKNVKWARSSRTAAVLDLDEDGDLDLVVNNFNDVPYVYANESPARHWVALDLVGGGGKTCRDAVGSVVTIEAGGKKQTAMVDSATGYLEQSTHRLYFGLGDAASLTHATVRWIGGAEEDVTAQVAIDKVNVVKQKK